MCGIVGYIGKQTDIRNLIITLKKLEYRGYDSSGVAYSKLGKIVCYKKVGQIDNLLGSLPKIKAKTVICHTRWATHGKVCEENAHPITSHNNNFAVVHNGIIENYLPLKQEIGSHLFKTNTDTEVIANLIETLSGTTLERVIKAESMLIGSYAGLIIEKRSKYLYAIKNHSPMYIAKTKQGFVVASDISCLNATEYYNLPNGVVARMSKQKIDFFVNGKPIELNTVKNTHQFNQTELGNYANFMEKEIDETPQTITNIINRYKNNPELVSSKIFDGISSVVLCGCGTAYHATLLGENWLKKLNLKCRAVVSSEFRYNPPILDESTLVILVSQSGETADTLAAGMLAKEHNSKTLAITNVEYSTLAGFADYVLPLCANAEIAVASTKAYSAMLAVLYILSMANTDFNQIEQSLYELCKMYLSPDIPQEIIDKVAGGKRVFFIGRGDDGVTANEGALKLKEIAYLDACGYYAGELKHGTIALIEPNVVVIAIVTDGKLKSKTLNAVEEVTSRGADAIIVTDDPTITGYPTILIPKTEIAELKSLLSIYPLQTLARLVCQKLGYNPDKPRNLAKSVTVE